MKTSLCHHVSFWRLLLCFWQQCQLEHGRFRQSRTLHQSGMYWHIYQHSFWTHWGKQEKSKLREPESRPRVEPGTFWTRSRGTNQLTSTVDDSVVHCEQLTQWLFSSVVSASKSVRVPWYNDGHIWFRVRMPSQRLRFHCHSKKMMGQ